MSPPQRSIENISEQNDPISSICNDLQPLSQLLISLSQSPQIPSINCFPLFFSFIYFVIIISVTSISFFFPSFFFLFIASNCSHLSLPSSVIIFTSVWDHLLQGILMLTFSFSLCLFLAHFNSTFYHRPQCLYHYVHSYCSQLFTIKDLMGWGVFFFSKWLGKTVWYILFFQFFPNPSVVEIHSYKNYHARKEVTLFCPHIPN